MARVAAVACARRRKEVALLAALVCRYIGYMIWNMKIGVNKIATMVGTADMFPCAQFTYTCSLSCDENICGWKPTSGRTFQCRKLVILETSRLCTLSLASWVAIVLIHLLLLLLLQLLLSAQPA